MIHRNKLFGFAVLIFFFGIQSWNFVEKSWYKSPDLYQYFRVSDAQATRKSEGFAGERHTDNGVKSGLNQLLSYPLSPSKYPHYVPTGLWKTSGPVFSTHIAPLTGLPLREKIVANADSQRFSESRRDETWVATRRDEVRVGIDFNSQIKPILADRCFKCHGPDENKVDAGLQLTSFAKATALLKSGKRAIVPFKPNESELVRRILTSDPDDVMPSPKSNLTLTEAEKKLLIQWIEQGAEYQEHWAFIPPALLPIPEVQHKAWVKNAIDHFILQKLEEKGLKPNVEATKESLIRRLSLDLTGLPPTVKEVRDFVADNSPKAYENQVDRLLASPHYGERMALEWLDVARYADSHGYQDDGLRNTYPYRDWVIRAFNQNLPFDQFVTWQLAGDLMPNPSPEQFIATCFNRNHQQSQEGGVVDEEYRVEYVADRVSTFGKAFLGLTTECARCHTHKYDPIEHKDYFSLFAFFNQNNDTGIVPYNGEASPTVILPTPAAAKSLDSLRALMKAQLPKASISAQYRQDLEKWLTELKSKDKAFLKKPVGRTLYLDFENQDSTLTNDMVTPPSKEELGKRAATLEKSKKDTTIKIKPLSKIKGYWNIEKADTNLKAATFLGDKDKYPLSVTGKNGRGLSFLGDAGVVTGPALNYDRYQPFSVSIWVKLLKKGEQGPIFNRTNGDAEGYRGWICKLNKDGTLSFQFNHVWPSNAIDFTTIDTLQVGEWTHIALTYDGSSKASGVRFWINGSPPAYKLVTDDLQKSILFGRYKAIRAKKNFMLGMEQGNNSKTIQHIVMDELQIFQRQLAEIEVLELFDEQERIVPLIEKNQRSEQEQAQLLELYLLRGLSPGFNASKETLLALRKQESDLATDQEEVMTMRDRTEYRKTYILTRGAYDAPSSTEVWPATPTKIFAFDEKKYPRNRLGLAQWLLAAENPLFARVSVNRYWQMIFGKGLVETQEDFGNQGALPSHPALLDWLALDFRAKNWDIKAFIKQMVLSVTYRQSSIPTPEAKEQDFSNVLYSRYPAHRLSAELVRDNALAASGLLVPQIGGPSVYPYQPAGLWEALATRNATNYVQNHGDSLYRRSIYTIWKRSAPPPAMLNFDATDRSYCVVRRQKTASPLQALVLMNDPQFVEAARILAEKMIKNSKDVAGRLEYGFQALTSRKPRPAELLEISRLFEKEWTHFKQHPELASQLLKVGEYARDSNLDAAEVAAYTIVASMLMNFDEFAVKR